MLNTSDRELKSLLDKIDLIKIFILYMMDSLCNLQKTLLLWFGGLGYDILWKIRGKIHEVSLSARDEFYFFKK